MTMIENRMVIDSEWPEEGTTPWENADNDDVEEYLIETGEIDDAVREYIDDMDLSDLYEAMPEWMKDKVIDEYIRRHEYALSESYNEAKSGNYLDD